MSIFKFLIILISLFFIQINIFSQSLIIDRVASSQSYHDTIIDFWQKFKPYVVSSIEYSDLNTNNLYKVQATTNALLRYSFINKKYELVDDLLEVYMNAVYNQDTLDRYNFTFFFPLQQPIDTIMLFDKTYNMWFDENDNYSPPKENILAISQFLALMSDAIFNISLIPEEDRTDTMKQFVNLYSQVLDSHYHRWVYGIDVYEPLSGKKYENSGPFQLRAWNCRYDDTYIPTHLTHMELVDLLVDNKCGDINSNQYCNSVTDTELWIIAGVSSFVAAHILDSSLVGDISYLDFYKDEYLPRANELLISRISTTIVLNFEDSLVWGVDFDNGMLDDHPDNKYSGYNTECVKIVFL